MFQLQFAGKKNVDINRIIDDFVFMCTLVGNDFLPHSPHMDIDSGALSIMLSTYRDGFDDVKTGGYLTDKEKIHPHRFEAFISKLSRFEAGFFQNRSVEEREAKWRAATYRKHYYLTKLNIDIDTDEGEAAVRLMVRDYLEGLHWVLGYYHNGCPSWGWFFPHLYSPLASDVVNIGADFYGKHKGRQMEALDFNQGVPFQSLAQLLSVLPPQSCDLLPASYASIMLKEGSPLAEYYPKVFTTDPNGKRQPWESVVQIPFIDEQALMAVVNDIDNNGFDERNGGLSKLERTRNVRGEDHIYA
jgi:5'-3' exoribonuclease 1